MLITGAQPYFFSNLTLWDLVSIERVHTFSHCSQSFKAKKCWGRKMSVIMWLFNGHCLSDLHVYCFLHIINIKTSNMKRICFLWNIILGFNFNFNNQIALLKKLQATSTWLLLHHYALNLLKLTQDSQGQLATWSIFFQTIPQVWDTIWYPGLTDDIQSCFGLDRVMKWSDWVNCSSWQCIRNCD